MGHRSQLVDTLVICPSGATHVGGVTQQKHVTAIEGARGTHPGDVEPSGQCFFDLRELTPSRLGSGSGDERCFTEDHCCVLDEHTVGVGLIGRHGVDCVPGLLEETSVFPVLGSGKL
jgi:hypothetical protein